MLIKYFKKKHLIRYFKENWYLPDKISSKAFYKSVYFLRFSKFCTIAEYVEALYCWPKQSTRK